jgi:hypothetical protein
MEANEIHINLETTPLEKIFRDVKQVAGSDVAILVAEYAHCVAKPGNTTQGIEEPQ